MATSNWQNISFNIELVRKINPHSILDIGAGFGRWGFLFREFLEVWDDGNTSGKWKRKIDTVEIYTPYIKEYHKYFYDNIFVGDATDFIKKTSERYDLINCGDVLEHFEKEKGVEFIKDCLGKCRYLLINIPVGKNWKQEGGENPYEEHKSVWKNSDFSRYPNYRIKEFRDINLRSFCVVLLSKEKFGFEEDFRKRYGKYFHVKNFIQNVLGINLFRK